MASPWQRHLLVKAGEGQEEAVLALSPEAGVVAAAMLLALALLVVLCTCKKRGSPKDEEGVLGIASGRLASTKACSMPADAALLTIDILAAGDTTYNSATPGETAPVGNGVAHGSKNGAPSSSHSRNESSGSGQMRPTSLRELPDLPVNSHKNSHSGAGAADKSASARNSAEEKGNNSAYDRLGAKASTSKAPDVNYDHINLESPRDFSSGTTPASEPDAVFEDHYAQVRERTYDVVKDARARTSSKVASSADYDPYAKVKDVDDDKEDPYAKVKDTEKEDGDGEYAHLKEDYNVASPDVNTSNVITIDDDEDPYEKVIGDSGSGMVLASADIIDPDDLYSVVSDQTSTAVVARSSGTSPSAEASSAVGDRRSGSNKNNSATDPLQLQFADEEGDAQDNYATVVKVRNSSTNREDRGSAEVGRSMEGEEEIEPYFTTPPEPPRLYGASEVGGAGGGAVEEASSRAESKERCYTKVTARESLASMTARNALNTYETVVDLPENTYATVEGGSGDGVVRYATPGTPNLQHSTGRFNETYAEIGASGSGGYATPAPEPPSLDSLHSMTKSTSSNDGEHGGNRAPTSPSASSTNVIIAEDGYAMVSKTSFSPSETALPQIPRAGTSGSVGSQGSLGEEVMMNGVTLHPDYHRVKDCIPDQDSENDPNYESVDEALSKVPASSATNSSSSPPSSSSAVMHADSGTATGGTPCITINIVTHASSPSRKAHQYEEVSPPTSPTASDRAPMGTAGATSSNSASSNSASSSRAAPKAQHSDSGEAAEVRDRVLQGHMYEAISDVKKKNTSRKSDADKQASGAIHSVKL